MERIHWSIKVRVEDYPDVTTIYRISDLLTETEAKEKMADVAVKVAEGLARLIREGKASFELFPTESR